MQPMSMTAPGGRPPWGGPNSSGMNMNSMNNYSTSSPGTYNGPPGGGPPGTPIMPNPQDTSSSQGGSDMYGIMKGGPSGPGGNIGPTSLPGQFPLGEGPGPMPMGPGDMPPVMNGDGIEGMKHSPHNGGPGTPLGGGGTPVSQGDSNGGPGGTGSGDNMGAYGGMGGYSTQGPPGPDSVTGVNDQTESAAILKIKESMQEEAKRFEKDTPTEAGSHSDYFGMQ